MRQGYMLPVIGMLLLASAACDDTSSAADTLAPNDAPEGVVLARSSFDAAAGDTSRLVAYQVDARGRRHRLANLEWTSNDSSVAVVDNGLLYIVNPGVATLSAAANGKSVSASVRAGAAVAISQIDIFPDPFEVAVGATGELRLMLRYSSDANIENRLGAQWKSLTPSIASVTNQGVVRGIKQGTARIVATRARLADTVTVNVGTPPAAVSPTLTIAPDTAVVEVGKTAAFAAAVSAGSPTDVSWSVSSTSVATVSSTGVVTGKSVGTAIVRAVRGTQRDSGVVRVKAATVVAPTPPPTTTQPPPTSGGGSTTTPPPAPTVPVVTSGPAIARAPDLPRVFLNTRYVAPTGRTIRVANGGNLQAAIDAAQPGDEILLARGSTFTGQFKLRAKTGGTAVIVIRTEGALPPEGVRMSPATARSMGLARIVSDEFGPVIRTDARADNYRLVALQFEVDPRRTSSYSIVRFGNPEGSQKTMDAVPDNLVLDRSYVFGHDRLEVRRCVELHSSSSAVIDSYLAGCHLKGGDSQAIWGANGPGPYKIVNNFLEGAGENVMFGGSSAYIPGMVPSDIEIRRNHFFKPLEWQVSRAWTVKNLFELKTGKRVLVEGNVFENNWSDAQVGTAIVLKSVGSQSYAETSHITFRYNVIKNVGAAFSVAARPEKDDVVPASSMSFTHNLVDGQGKGSTHGTGSGRFMIMSSELNDIIIENNTSTDSERMILFTKRRDRNGAARLQVRNNVIAGSINSDESKSPWLPAINHHAPGALFAGNVIISSQSGDKPLNNAFVDLLGQVGLLNPAGSDYRFLSSSPFRLFGTDRRDPGVDYTALNAATAGVVQR